MPASDGIGFIEFSVSLVNNIALLIALTQIHGLLMRRILQEGRINRFTSIVLPGLLYGCVVIVGIETPVVVRPGLIFDGRSVVLSLAAVFAGPWAGGIAALMSALYRWQLGGPGALMGVAVIVESINVFMSIWRYCSGRYMAACWP